MEEPDNTVRLHTLESQLEPERQRPGCERRRQQRQSVEGEPQGRVGEGEEHRGVKRDGGRTTP